MICEDLIILIITAVALHIFVDFHLQGLLADLKQQRWWLDNVFSKGFSHRYDKDYLAALIIHGLEWSIFVHIPFLIMVYLHYPEISVILLGSVLLHAILHAFIDDLKCNRLKLSLIQDQLLHFGQIIVIIVTYIVAINYI